MTTAQADIDAGRTKPRKFNIFVNDEKYRVSDRRMTGAELKSLSGVPEANHLFLDVRGPGEDRQILDDDTVTIKSGLHFYDVPIGNLGAR